MAAKSPAMSHLLLMSCGYVSNQSLVAGVGLEHGLEQRVRGYGGKGSSFLPFFLSFFHSAVYTHSNFKVSIIFLNI